MNWNNTLKKMGFKYDGFQFVFVKYGKTTSVEFDRGSITVRTRTGVRYSHCEATGATFTKSVPTAAVLAYVREVV